VAAFSDPAGYFITLSAYGDRLHGDVRGSVDWTTNEFDTPPLEPNSQRERREQRLMQWPAMLFDEQVRSVIERAVAEVCETRGWTLHACHCRTNHVHLVLSAESTTARVLHDLKAIATRRLREASAVAPKRPVWAEHGSTRYLWTTDDIAGACWYVVNGQGGDLRGGLQPGPWANDLKSEDPQ
jgi:REP element-mobilizing transposase RayT